MGNRKNKSTAYRVAVGGAKGLLRLLVYLCIVLAIVFAGKAAYNFGYQVFDETPMAETKEAGQDVTVIVKEDESVYQIAQTLEKKGLIERPIIFWVQERLSDYHGKIKPGTYILNTHQVTEEMLAILTGENTEGQPVTDENLSGTDAEGTEQ